MPLATALLRRILDTVWLFDFALELDLGFDWELDWELDLKLDLSLGLPELWVLGSTFCCTLLLPTAAFVAPWHAGHKPA